MKGTRKTKKETKRIDLTQPGEASDQKLKSSGLGDAIASITEPVLKTIGKEPCEGCKSRQNQLNKLFPWLRQAREYTEDETEFIRSLSGKTQLSAQEVRRVFSLYNEVLPQKPPVEICNCPGLIIKLIQRLESFI